MTVELKLLLVGFDLGKAIAAVDRTVGLGLKRHTGFAAAGSAGSREEGALAAVAGVVLASIAALLAALGLILEAALRVEFLLTGGENELFAALFAYQGLVLVHLLILSLILPLGLDIAFSFRCCRLM
jgi:hypothetical protein